MQVATTALGIAVVANVLMKESVVAGFGRIVPPLKKVLSFLRAIFDEFDAKAFCGIGFNRMKESNIVLFRTLRIPDHDRYRLALVVAFSSLFLC